MVDAFPLMPAATRERHAKQIFADIDASEGMYTGEVANEDEDNMLSEIVATGVQKHQHLLPLNKEHQKVQTRR